jgi:hypothetical protein
MVVSVEIDASTLNLLVTLHWMTPAQADDPRLARKAAGKAIAALLLQASRRGR